MLETRAAQYWENVQYAVTINAINAKNTTSCDISMIFDKGKLMQEI